MERTMKGWQFNGTNQPLEFVEKEWPELDEGYVRLKVLNAGLCSSDVGALHDPTWMASISAPVNLGHEICGEIVEFTGEHGDWEIGDVVSIYPMSYEGAQGPGYGRDGGYGTYTSAHYTHLVKVPENVDTEQAAAATDAGMTSYHAVAVRGEVKEGTKVGIIGLGGLGTVGMDIAVGMDAEVYVATRKEAAQNKAKEHGAHKVAANITEFKEDNLDVIVDFAGAGVTTKEALETVKPGGKVVLVGMHKLEFPINANDMILRETSLLGSVGGSIEDLEAVLDLMSQGKLKIGTQPIPLEDVANGLKRLEDGEADDRQVMYTQEKDFQ